MQVNKLADKIKQLTTGEQPASLPHKRLIYT